MRSVERLPTRSREFLTGRMVTAYLLPALVGAAFVAIAAGSGASLWTAVAVYVLYLCLLALGLRRWQQRSIIAARTKINHARVELALRELDGAEKELHAVRNQYARSVLTVRVGWYLQVFEAMARERVPGSYRNGAEEGSTNVLAGVRRGCMDHMSGDWPKLRAFLEAHHLLGR